MNSTPGSDSRASTRERSGHSRGHLLQFYEDDDFLCDLVSEYLLGGLQMNERLLVLSVASHQQQLEHSLRAHEWDFDAALASGRVTMIDADMVLPALALDDTADPFTPLFDGLLRPGEPAHVRVYGELAGMCWANGQTDTSMAIERAWNQLARAHSFTLLCSYRVNLMDVGDASAFADLCASHTQTLPSEHCTSRGRLSERLRYLFMIEQTLARRNLELLEARKTELLLRETVASLHAGIAATGDALGSGIRELSAQLTLLSEYSAAGDSASASELLARLLLQTRGMSGLLHRFMAPTAGWSSRPPPT